MTDRDEASVLVKIDRILGAFSGEVVEVGLTQLSRLSAVPKTTVHRLANQMVDLGYLAKTTRGYQLGWRVYELGQVVPGPAQLRSIARPVMVDVRAATNALVVHLAVLHGSDVVYLERLGGRHARLLLSAVGSTVAAPSTLSGRVLLAYRGASEPIEDADLAAELDLIQQRRWGVEEGRYVPGSRTYSVPIEFPRVHRVIATLAATIRADRADDTAVIHALWAASVQITRSLAQVSSAIPDGFSSR